MRRLRAVFLVGAVLSGLGLAQTPERRVLAWSDFTGAPDPASPFDAHTHWKVRYRYDAPLRAPGGFVVDVKVGNTLEPDSWVRPAALRRPSQARLLAHEQGHYDIGLLCALKFRKAVRARTFTRAYHAEVQALFDAALEEARRMDLDYDADSKHMKDTVQQARWERRLAEAIAVLGGPR
ncbi:MAG: hypothetical protein U0P81_09720 [Holophagaceae bacterium]